MSVTLSSVLTTDCNTILKDNGYLLVSFTFSWCTIMMGDAQCRRVFFNLWNSSSLLSAMLWLFSSTCQRMNIWSLHDLPRLKPACFCQNLPSVAYLNLSSNILKKTFLGTDIWPYNTHISLNYHAWYSLFVLKVPLNTNQPVNQRTSGKVCLSHEAQQVSLVLLHRILFLSLWDSRLY